MAKTKKKLKVSDIKKNNNTEVISTIDRIKRHEREYLLVTALIFMVIIAAIGYSLLGVKEDVKSNSYDSDIMGTSEVITLNEESIVDNNAAGLLLDKNSFTITNSGKGEHKFKVFIISDQAMIDLDGCGDRLANDDSIYFRVNNGDIKSLNEVATEDGYLILEDSIKKESKDYDLYIWILRDKLHDFDRNHFHGNIMIEEVEEE